MIDRRTVTVPHSVSVGIVVGASIVVGVLVMVGIAGNRALTKLDAIATEGQKSAERNTELLVIECDLGTGRPKLAKGKDYVNSRRFLGAYCARLKKRADEIAGYITTIRTDVAALLTTQENNLFTKLDEVKAAVEERPAPVVVRVPISGSRPTRTPPPTVAPRAGGSPPPAAAPPPPVVTTTTCPKRGGSGKCK